jgi:hypothetical protein
VCVYALMNVYYVVLVYSILYFTHALTHSLRTHALILVLIGPLTVCFANAHTGYARVASAVSDAGELHIFDTRIHQFDRANRVIKTRCKQLYAHVSLALSLFLACSLSSCILYRNTHTYTHLTQTQINTHTHTHTGMDRHEFGAAGLWRWHSSFV